MQSFLEKNLSYFFFAGILSLPFIALGNFFLFLIFLSLLFTKVQIPKIDFQTSLLILYLIFTVFSVFFSIDPPRSFLELKEILNYSLYFFSLIYFYSKRIRDSFIYLFLIPSVFLSLYGIIEYFIKVPKDPLYRIHGLQSHYMTYSGILLIYFGILLSYGILGKDLKLKKVSYLSSALTLPPIFLSLTRNSWIGVFSILFFLLLFLKKRYLVLIILIPLSFSLFFPSTVGKRFLSIFDLKDQTNLDRIKMWQTSIKIFFEKPITGLGLGIAQRDYYFYKDEGGIRNRIPHYHSNIFQILAERGIFALLSYLFFIFFGLYNNYKNKDKWYGMAGFLSLFAISLSGLFEFNFGDTEILWFTLLISNFHRIKDEDL